MIHDDQVNKLFNGDYYRFVADGIEPYDLAKIKKHLYRWNDWCSIFSEFAQKYVQLADESLRSSNRITAGESFWKASLYYHYGQYKFWQRPNEKFAAHIKKVKYYKRAAPLFKYPGKRVDIPYKGAKIPGYLRLPGGSSKPAIVILISNSRCFA